MQTAYTVRVAPIEARFEQAVISRAHAAEKAHDAQCLFTASLARGKEDRRSVRWFGTAQRFVVHVRREEESFDQRSEAITFQVRHIRSAALHARLGNLIVKSAQLESTIGGCRSPHGCGDAPARRRRGVVHSFVVRPIFGPIQNPKPLSFGFRFID